MSKPFIVSCCLEERWGDVVNPWEMSFIAECCSGLKASFIFGSQIMVWGHFWITQNSWSVQCMRKCIELGFCTAKVKEGGSCCSLQHP